MKTCPNPNLKMLSLTSKYLFLEEQDSRISKKTSLRRSYTGFSLTPG